jgi:hypothetical protein
MVNTWLQYRLGIASNRNPWGYLARVAWMRARRPLCVLRRHKHWSGHDTTLTALASGRSKRCPSCNRLILKPQYRRS